MAGAGRLVAALWVALALALPAAAQQQPAPAADPLVVLYQRATQEMAVGRHERAVLLFADAVALAERRFGPVHSNVGVLLENLATAQEAAGRLADAEKSLRRSAEVLRAAAGPRSTAYFTVSANLGALLLRRGKVAEAEPPLLNAYEGLRALSGDSHPGLVRIGRDLAWLYRDAAAYDKAAAVESFLLPLIERLYGRNSDDYARLLAQSAETQIALGQSSAALQMVRAAE